MTADLMNAPMSAGELVVAREALGLTGDWIARVTHVIPRTQRRRESGEFKIPPEVWATIATLEEVTTSAVSELVAAAAARTEPGVILLRTDSAYQQAAPTGIAFPARWHRAVAARAQARLPQLLIAFEGEPTASRTLETWIRPVVSVTNLTTRLDEMHFTTTRTVDAT